MESSERVAVYIRGHIRTWDYIKQLNFDFFDSLPWHIDFYLATWTYSEKKLNRLKKDFKNRNLKTLKTLPRTNFYNPWTAPAAMSTELSKVRKEEELKNNISYKFIIETRFDVILGLLATPQIPNDNSFGTTEIEGNFIPNSSTIVSGLSDHCFLTKSDALDIMNLRLSIDAGDDGNHITLMKFAKNHNIEIFKINWFSATISRPNIVETDNTHSWNTLPEDKKMNYLRIANIDPYDYAETYHVGNTLRDNDGF